jgi:hypothetical protein
MLWSSTKEILQISTNQMLFFTFAIFNYDHLCGLMVEFLATDPEVPGSIPGHYKGKEKW